MNYCKGYNQSGQIFNSELTVSQSISISGISSNPRWGHFINEIQISNNGGDSSHLNTSLLEADGLIELALSVSSIPTISGGTTNLPFILSVDIHYQTTGVLGTKNDNYPFYT